MAFNHSTYTAPLHLIDTVTPACGEKVWYIFEPFQAFDAVDHHIFLKLQITHKNMAHLSNVLLFNIKQILIYPWNHTF